MSRSNWPKGGRYKPRKGDFPPPVRRRILKAHPVCTLAFPDICTVKSTQAHHIVEVEDGGSNTFDNGTGVCASCHTRYSAQRSARKVWDWQRKPERHPGVLD